MIALVVGVTLQNIKMTGSNPLAVAYNMMTMQSVALCHCMVLLSIPCFYITTTHACTHPPAMSSMPVL